MQKSRGKPKVGVSLDFHNGKKRLFYSLQLYVQFLAVLSFSSCRRWQQAYQEESDC